jgi:hypothetical protein
MSIPTSEKSHLLPSVNKGKRKGQGVEAPAQESRLHLTHQHRFGAYERPRRRSTNVATPEPTSARVATKLSTQTSGVPPEEGRGLALAVALELALVLALRESDAVLRTVCPSEVKT